MPDQNEDLDFGGVEFVFDAAGAVRELLPRIIKELLNDGWFRRQLVNALMPEIRAQVAQDSRNKGNSLPPWSN